MIDEWDARDDARRIGARARTIGEDFAIERPLLARLPDDDFETGIWLSPRVDRYSQVTVRTNRYSVPVRLVGRQVRVQLHASHLVVYDGREQVAWHERLMAEGGSRLDLDHYLEALVRKPGALPGATALAQARAAGRFTPVHDAWWAAARKAHGDAAGTRALIEVLLLHRDMPHQHVVAGLATAVRAGALTADAVALEARKFADTDDHPTVSARGSRTLPANVISLTERRPAQLPADTRPLPTVTAYDQLLRRRSSRSCCARPSNAADSTGRRVSAPPTTGWPAPRPTSPTRAHISAPPGRRPTGSSTAPCWRAAATRSCWTPSTGCGPSASSPGAGRFAEPPIAISSPSTAADLLAAHLTLTATGLTPCRHGDGSTEA